MKHSLKNILVIRLDRLGDVLMNVPLIHRLKDNFPQSRLTVLCQPSIEPALSQIADIDSFEYATFPEIESWGGLWRLYRRLKAKKFDCVVMTHSHKRLHVLAWALGAKWRLGFDRKWGCFLNYKRPDTKDSDDVHEFNQNLAVVDCLCPKPWNGGIQLGFKHRLLRASILSKFGIQEDEEFCVFHVTTSNPQKQWPLEQFAQVASRFLAQFKGRIFLVGAEKREEIEQAFKEVLDSQRVVNFIGRTDLTELAVILGATRFCLSLDSGPYHLAWMQKTPVVGIFSRDAQGSRPVRWGVYNNYALNIQIFKHLSEITVEEVLIALLGLAA